MEISVENWLHAARLGLSRESAGYSYLRTQLQILRIHMKCQEQQAASVCRLSRQGQDRLISGAHGPSSLADQVSSRFRDRPCLWHTLTRMHACTHKGTPSPGIRLYHTVLYYYETGFHPEHEWPASPSVSAPVLSLPLPHSADVTSVCCHSGIFFLKMWVLRSELRSLCLCSRCPYRQKHLSSLFY